MEVMKVVVLMVFMVVMVLMVVVDSQFQGILIFSPPKDGHNFRFRSYWSNDVCLDRGRSGGAQSHRSSSRSRIGAVLLWEKLNIFFNIKLFANTVKTSSHFIGAVYFYVYLNLVFLI